MTTCLPCMTIAALIETNVYNRRSCNQNGLHNVLIAQLPLREGDLFHGDRSGRPYSAPLTLTLRIVASAEAYENCSAALTHIHPRGRVHILAECILLRG